MGSLPLSAIATEKERHEFHAGQESVFGSGF